MRKINLLDEVNGIEALYVYKKVASLNEHILSVVNVADRTLDFHIHEHSDELFYVIDGTFELETDDGLTELQSGEFIVVPRNIRHRPVVKGLTKFLMIELAGTLNRDNSGELYEDQV